MKTTLKAIGIIGLYVFYGILTFKLEEMGGNFAAILNILTSLLVFLVLIFTLDS